MMKLVPSGLEIQLETYISVLGLKRGDVNKPNLSPES